jgi:DHA3 family macrolide efflux protein-like MFS transporter
MSTPFRPHRRVFVIVWVGQLVSLFGSGLTSFALGVWVYTRTGSVTQFALILLCRTLPVVILSPIAGALVDRWNKRLTMIGGDIGAACSSLLIVVLYLSGSLQVWHIYVAAVVSSLGEMFQSPAYLSTISVLVPEAELGRANGMVQLAQAISDVATPLLAGLMVVTIHLSGVILIDFATFLFAAATLIIVRFPAVPKPEHPQRRLLDEVGEGLKFVGGQAGLVALLFFGAVVAFLGGVIGATVEPMVLALTTPDRLGIVLSVAGCGLLLGGIVMSLWGGPQRRVIGILAGVFVFGAFIVLLGLRPSIPLIAMGAFGAHFTFPFINSNEQVIWQSRVAVAMQGRVFALRQMIGRAAQPLAFLIAGPLIDRVLSPSLAEGGLLAGNVGQIIGIGAGRGIALLLVIAGLVTMVVACTGALYPALRRVESDRQLQSGRSQPTPAQSPHTL